MALMSTQTMTKKKNEIIQLNLFQWRENRTSFYEFHRLA